SSRSSFTAGTNGVAALATNLISIPRRTIATDCNAWINFVTNNTSKLIESNGLRTEVRLVVGPTIFDAWGGQVSGGPVHDSVFMLSHTALPDSTNYFYLIEGAGVWLYDPSNSEPLVFANGSLTNQCWST